MTSLDLVADIGGTHARFALFSEGHLSHISVIKHRDVETFHDALDQYLDTCNGLKPNRCCLAVATPITGDTVALTNSHWTISRSDISRRFDFQSVELINDFTALANALPFLHGEDLRQFGGSAASTNGPRALLGAGTGLGVSGLLTAETGQTIALAGEGGHVCVPQGNETDRRVFDRLESQFGRVSLERILSGDGLRNVHWALSNDETEALDAQPEASDISAMAKNNESARAVETMRVFTRMLGCYAGDLALILGASGGVFIGGGIATAIVDSLDSWGLRKAFDEKGRMSRVVQPIPLYVICHPHPGLIGAARSLAQRTTA